jgi:opacity protein-like surface antigen
MASGEISPMMMLSKFFLAALLVVAALFPSVAAAQVVPTSYWMDRGNWYYCSDEDHNGSASGTCFTIGCKPEVDYPEECDSQGYGSGTASVGPNRIELTLNVHGNAWASQSLQFTLEADCCVTYDVEASGATQWHVSFLNPDEANHRSGKVSVPAGSYSASLSTEFWDEYTSIVLVFDYEFCDEDCDADGQVDSDQITRGSAPDVNGNGVLDVCDFRAGDLNLDGVVGSADLTLLLGAWGGTLPEITDLTGDGVVNSADLSFLLSKWNT